MESSFFLCHLTISVLYVLVTIKEKENTIQIVKNKTQFFYLNSIVQQIISQIDTQIEIIDKS